MKINNEKSKILILIDSNALIHRSFHALPPLTTKKGEIVNGVYGFCSILLKVLKEFKPDYIAATFDLPEPTFRHLEYKEYKANRPKTPEELKTQFGRVKEILAAFKIPIYEKSGFEADDIIGTITNKTKEDKKTKTVIVTGDLDLLQLISGDNIEVETLKRGITDTVVYDAKAVAERFNLKPEQLIDFKALKGDPSDNIPGVPGIGEKTASALINKFGSLEAVYKEIEKKDRKSKDVLSEKMALKLTENKEQAFLSKKLVTIKLDVPIEFNFEESKFGEYDKSEVIKIFQEMEFYTLLDRLPDFQKKTEEKQSQDTLFASAFTDFQFSNLKNDVQKSGKLVVAAAKDGSYFYLSPDASSIFKIDLKDIENFKDLLEDEKILKIGHDLKVVLKNFKRPEIEMNGLVFDTKIASYLLNPGERDYELQRIVFRELGLDISAEQALFLKIWDLKIKLEKKMAENKLNDVFEKVEMPLIKVLAEMESRGLIINEEILENISKDAAGQITEYEKKIYKSAGEEFNINSPSQLSVILFEKLKISPKGLRKTPGGVISTQASELLKLKSAQDAHPIIGLILEYREIMKIKNTYLDALPEMIDRQTGRLHTTFIQTGTATGRLASEHPNLQNIPIKSPLGKKIRSAFISPDGWSFVAFDYSQMELRIIASLASDQKMIQAFKDGKDIHLLTAAEINNIEESKVTADLRRQAKTLNFGVVYGMSAKSFAETVGISEDQAKTFIREYFEDFSGIKSYIDEMKIKAGNDGYVKTLLGRRRYLPELHSPNWQLRQAAERMAVNMPVQGLEADIIKMAMIEIYNQILLKEEGVRMVLQVHDELVFEIKNDKIKEAAPKIKRIMEGVFKIEVPLEVTEHIGKNWSELK